MDRLEEKLLERDYLILDSPEAVHLSLNHEDGYLGFSSGEKIIYRVRTVDFLSHPEVVLEAFSKKVDTNSLFRYLVLLSLLGGFPLLLYIILYAVLNRIIGWLGFGEWSKRVASILCLLLGLMAFFQFKATNEYSINPKEVGEALKSESWPYRTAALKLIEEKNLEIGAYRSYRGLLASPHVLERTWLARALGKSRMPSTVKDLVTLADDPWPNVACMALQALGNRRDRKSIPFILERIKSSDHWYTASYAYRALKAMGWKQKKSN
jgi:hypothetical protein